MRLGASNNMIFGHLGSAISSAMGAFSSVRPLPKPGASSYARSSYAFDKILPKIKGPRYELRYAHRRTLARDVLELAFGREHKIYSALGLAVNTYSIMLALSHYAMQVGPREFISQFRSHAATEDKMPVEHNDFIDIARRHYLEGIDRYARTMCLDVSMEGMEKLPKDGTIFMLAANHASIFSDFLFAWADPAAVPVAAAENFSDAASVRMSGAGLYFDLMGLPLIRRANGKNGESVERGRVSASDGMSQRLTELIELHGTRPIYFGQGGRVPTAYDDQGQRAKAGFYSNVPDPLEPGTYFQAGAVILNAWRHAKRTGSDVALALLTLTGTERVMPKHAAREFPFFGEARIGERIEYRIVDVLTVSPRERRLRDLAARAERLLKEDIGIDAYLEGVVDGWGELYGKPELAEQFRRAAAADESYLIIADRIRNFHPMKQRERWRYTERIVDCIERHADTGEVPKEMLAELLVDVSVPM